jgi:iron-sulfur cluster assembly accessory protein
MNTTVNVTERAANRICEIAGQANLKALRVSVNGGGCSGFQYEFALADQAMPDDLVIERNGARVLIDPVSLPFMAGATVDFVDDLIGQSFRIENPMAKSSCGCGTSFSV